MRRFSPRLERLVAAAGLAAAFVIMASVFVPLDSGAATHRLPAHQDGLLSAQMPWSEGEDEDHSAWHSDSTDPHIGLPMLGSIERGRFLLVIYGGNDEPRYSVYSEDGELLGALLRAEQVAELFPEVDPSSMQFDVPGSLLHVGTISERWNH